MPWYTDDFGERQFYPAPGERYRTVDDDTGTADGLPGVVDEMSDAGHCEADFLDERLRKP